MSGSSDARMPGLAAARPPGSTAHGPPPYAVPISCLSGSLHSAVSRGCRAPTANCRQPGRLASAPCPPPTDVRPTSSTTPPARLIVRRAFVPRPGHRPQGPDPPPTSTRPGSRVPGPQHPVTGHRSPVTGHRSPIPGASPQPSVRRASLPQSAIRANTSQPDTISPPCDVRVPPLHACADARMRGCADARVGHWTCRV